MSKCIVCAKRTKYKTLFGVPICVSCGPIAEENAAKERYREAIARGLSDAEAREEGWPAGGSIEYQVRFE